MYIDLVFPSKNEKKFIHLASLLGYGGLCLVYSAKDFSQKKIEELQLQSPIKLYGAIKTEKTKNKTNSDLIISESTNEKNNRQLLEKGNTNIIFNLENQQGNDFIHQRNSGLNHILCNLAHKNNKAIGISFSNLLNTEFNPQIIGRLLQNFSLCKKYKTKIIFASFAKEPGELRSPFDLNSFLLSFGVENRIAKESLVTLSLMIDAMQKEITKHIKIQ